MKNFFIMLAISFSATMFASTPQDYDLIAQQWIAAYVENSDGSLRIAPADLHILLNLAAISYERSASTLQAQEATLKAVTTSWQLLQNVTQTRRNPSKSIPYQHNAVTYQNIMKQAWNLQQHHQQIGTSYAAFIELVVNQSPSPITPAINELREKARALLVATLGDLRTQVQAVIDACNTTTKQPEEVVLKRLSLIDYVLSLLPKIAVNGFVEADRLSIKASEEGWTILSEIQLLDNQLWQIIEKARTSFYAAIYNRLYDCARKQQLVPAWTTVLVAQEQQLVTTDQQLPTKLYFR